MRVPIYVTIFENGKEKRSGSKLPVGQHGLEPLKRLAEVKISCSHKGSWENGHSPKGRHQAGPELFDQS